MHDDQLEITPHQVRQLLADQFPEWIDLAVEQTGAEGTVHSIFRIGDDVSARFPLRPGDPNDVRRSLEAEQAALDELGPSIRVPVPRPIAIGDPGHGYPLPWALQTWLPGRPAWSSGLADSAPLALDIAELINAVRSIPTAGRTFDRTGRGGDLRRHDDWGAMCLDRSHHLVPTDQLAGLWQRWRQLPRDTPETIVHGDLVPGNLLVDHRSRLCGLLDPGSFGAADPALDLVAAWHLFDDGPRRALRERLDVGDLSWARGQAWAFEQAIGLVWYYEQTNPAMSRLGRRTLGRLLDHR